MDDREQREAIVSAATQLFARFGLEKTTMADIAKNARKGKSSLYYYFESKEQVFAAVIEKEIEGLKAVILRAIDLEDDPAEKFRKFVSTRLSYLGDKADEYTSIGDEHLKHYEFIQKLTAGYSQWEMLTIRKILKTGRDSGQFEVTDLKGVSRAIFFALKGLEYPWITNLKQREVEASVKILVNLLIKGISKS